MQEYYYEVVATTGSNVGSVMATSKENALEWLRKTYTPTQTAVESPNINYHLIDRDEYDRRGPEIEEERRRQIKA
jgi:hypothetical protein